MKVSVLTQFPEMFGCILNSSILGRAQEKKLIEFDILNIRDYTKDRHNRTDDTPFGGGAGMVMTPQPAFDALDAVNASEKRCIYMSPRGKMLSKELAMDLSEVDELVILCGHYEGIDQRIINKYNMQEISIGDYILTGGELPAMVLIDTVSRLIPGVLSSEESSLNESIYSGLLEADMYTKPREYNGLCVPDVLFGGDHKKIYLWQYENSLVRTKEARPDLFKKYTESVISGRIALSKDERKIFNKINDGK